jgi:hypothetical protein
MIHAFDTVRNRDTLTSTIAYTFPGAITMLFQIARCQPRDPRRRQNLLAALPISHWGALGGCNTDGDGDVLDNAVKIGGDLLSQPFSGKR